MRSVATFESGKFNLTEHRDYFINEGCYGDDLGKWLIAQLRASGADTDTEPGQEDFGWYVNYKIDSQPFCAVIGNVGGEFWFVAVERVTGLLGSILGARSRNVPHTGIMRLHQILLTSPDVKNLEWHHWEIFKKGGENAFSAGGAAPNVP